MPRRQSRSLTCLALALAVGSEPARSPSPEPVPSEQSGPSERLGSDPDKAVEKMTRQLELDAVQRTLKTTAEARAAREAELNTLRTDRAKLNAALISTSQRLQETEARVSANEQRLSTLAYSEGAIRRSLDGRRSVIVEVLAALQRVGRRPPPAVLVRPEDMLQAVRTSMLLGAVLPELRSETEALATDLAELVRLEDAAASERETLAGDVGSLVEDRAKLAELVGARQTEIAAAERDAADQAQKAGALASRAQSLKDLIGRLETELETSARVVREAQDAAEKADAEARKATENQVRQTRDKIAALAFRDPARLAPKVSFAEMRRPSSAAGQRQFNQGI
jgi:septal ring factor EnvC (AmiA/AmiB activator)